MWFVTFRDFLNTIRSEVYGTEDRLTDHVNRQLAVFEDRVAQRVLDLMQEQGLRVVSSKPARKAAKPQEESANEQPHD